MFKIFIIFSILIINFYFCIKNPAICYATPEAEKAIEFCQNGDKIIDYYEQLEDKSNPNRYLNAAKYYYYQASRLDLSNPNSLIGHARVALHQNRLRDAKNVLMIALNFNEKNPRVNFYLGETFFADGEYTQAIDYYQAAFHNGYKNDFKTNSQLGLCYEKLGDIQKSIEHYNIALKTQNNKKEIKEKIQNLNKIQPEEPQKQKTQTEEFEEIITEEDKNILNKPNL